MCMWTGNQRDKVEDLLWEFWFSLFLLTDNLVIATSKKQDKEGIETVSYLDQTKLYALTHHNKEFRSEWEEV